MAISSFKRYEMKYLLSAQQFNALIPRLSLEMQPDAYCQGGKFYSIYNIYYDTVDDDLIRASLLKPYYKEKLRMRSYSAPLGQNDKVFLELKKKTGGIVHKRRAVMTLGEAEAFVQTGVRPASSDYINTQVINELAFFLNSNAVIPSVYIGYKRMAYFGKDDREFRLTFDFDIRTRREGLSLSNGCEGSPLLADDRFLMELKVPDVIPLWLARSFSELCIHKSSFSKYGEEFKDHCHNETLDTKRLITSNLYSIPPKLCAN